MNSIQKMEEMFKTLPDKRTKRQKDFIVKYLKENVEYFKTLQTELIS